MNTKPRVNPTDVDAADAIRLYRQGLSFARLHRRGYSEPAVRRALEAAGVVVRTSKQGRAVSAVAKHWCGPGAPGQRMRKGAMAGGRR